MYSVQKNCSLALLILLLNLLPGPSFGQCSIDSVNIGIQSSCDGNTNYYSQRLRVYFQNPPPGDYLIVNQQAFEVLNNQFLDVNLSGLSANGKAVTLQVYFRQAPTCRQYFPSAFHAPAPCNSNIHLNATLQDNIAGDQNQLGIADPGDTLGYVARITNLGDSAKNARFGLNLLNPNLSVIPGSVQVGPIAIRDTFLFKLGCNVLDLATILSNDLDPDGGPMPLLKLVAIDTFSALGGRLKLQTTEIVYEPPPGSLAKDSFSYSIVDVDGILSTSLVVLQPDTTASVCYVQNNTSSTINDGSRAHPFLTLAAADSAVGCDIIYVFAGDSTDLGYDMGIRLDDDQQLIGEGVGLSCGGCSFQEPAGANPIFSNPDDTQNDGHAIKLNKNNTVQGITIFNTPDGYAFADDDVDVGTPCVDSVIVKGQGGVIRISKGGILSNFNFQDVSSNGFGIAAIELVDADGKVRIDTDPVTGISSPDGPGLCIRGGDVSLDFSGRLTQANDNVLVEIGNGHTGTVIFEEGSFLEATDGDGMTFDQAMGDYQFLGCTNLNGGNASISINSSNGNFVFGTGGSNITTIMNPDSTAFECSQSTLTGTYTGSICKNNAGKLIIFKQGSGKFSFHNSGQDSIFQADPDGEGILINGAADSLDFHVPVIIGTATTPNAGDHGLSLIGSNSGAFGFDSLLVHTRSHAGVYVDNVTMAGTFEIDTGTVVSDLEAALLIENIAIDIHLDSARSDTSPNLGIGIKNASGSFFANKVVVVNTGQIPSGPIIRPGSGGGGPEPPQLLQLNIPSGTGCGMLIDDFSGFVCITSFRATGCTNEGLNVPQLSAPHPPGVFTSITIGTLSITPSVLNSTSSLANGPQGFQPSPLLTTGDGMICIGADTLRIEEGEIETYQGKAIDIANAWLDVTLDQVNSNLFESIAINDAAIIISSTKGSFSIIGDSTAMSSGGRIIDSGKFGLRFLEVENISINNMDIERATFSGLRVGGLNKNLVFNNCYFNENASDVLAPGGIFVGFLPAFPGVHFLSTSIEGYLAFNHCRIKNNGYNGFPANFIIEDQGFLSSDKLFIAIAHCDFENGNASNTAGITRSNNVFLNIRRKDSVSIVVSQSAFSKAAHDTASIEGSLEFNSYGNVFADLTISGGNFQNNKTDINIISLEDTSLFTHILNIDSTMAPGDSGEAIRIVHSGGSFHKTIISGISEIDLGRYNPARGLTYEHGITSPLQSRLMLYGDTLVNNSFNNSLNKAESFSIADPKTLSIRKLRNASNSFEPITDFSLLKTSMNTVCAKIVQNDFQLNASNGERLQLKKGPPNFFLQKEMGQTTNDPAEILAASNTGIATEYFITGTIKIAPPDSCVSSTVINDFSIQVTDGFIQETPIHKAFQIPLEVTLVKGDGEPIVGATVTFISDSTLDQSISPATHTAVTNARGVASIPATANGEIGWYRVEAKYNGKSAYFHLRNRKR